MATDLLHAAFQIVSDDLRHDLVAGVIAMPVGGEVVGTCFADEALIELSCQIENSDLHLGVESMVNPGEAFVGPGITHENRSGTAFSAQMDHLAQVGFIGRENLIIISRKLRLVVDALDFLAFVAWKSEFIENIHQHLLGVVSPQAQELTGFLMVSSKEEEADRIIERFAWLSP